MPLSLIFFTVCVLMVAGIISLTDAVIRLILNPKSSPKSVIMYIPDSPETLEFYIKKTIKKYPYSKITVHIPTHSNETKKITELLKKDYPYISIIDNIWPYRFIQVFFYTKNFLKFYVE